MIRLKIDFRQQFSRDHFINRMSLAFYLFYPLFATSLGNDMARRGLNNPQIFGSVSLLLLGPLAYLCLRPPLPENSAEVASGAVNF